jgi:hypothetical protein
MATALWQVPVLFAMIALGSVYFHARLSMVGQVRKPLRLRGHTASVTNMAVAGHR